MRKVLLGVILLSVLLLLAALIRFGFDAPVAGIDAISERWSGMPERVPQPQPARPISPELAEARNAPLPRLVAIVMRGGEQKALMLGPDNTPRTYRVGDRLPASDAEIIAMDDSSITVRRFVGEQRIEVTPPDPVAPPGDDGPSGFDKYSACSGLTGQGLTDCYGAIDQRASALRDACEQFKDDDINWKACMEAADRAEPYPG